MSALQTTWRFLSPAKIALFAMAGLASAVAPAQPGQGRGGFAADPRVEQRSYRFTETDEDLEYCLFASSKIDPDEPAPLIITLHGYGAGPQFMCNSTAVDLAEQGGYILAAPMGYSTSGWYGVPAGERRNVGRGGGAAPPENLGELSEMDVMTVLAMLREEFNVDENRIYLTGHSMGAAGTVYLGAKYADIWAAIAPVAGGGRVASPERLARLKEAGVPVLVVHGDIDETAPVEEARAFVAAMDEMGLEHAYVELPGISHGPAITASQPHVYDFFGRQSK